MPGRTPGRTGAHCGPGQVDHEKKGSREGRRTEVVEGDREHRLRCPDTSSERSFSFLRVPVPKK